MRLSRGLASCAAVAMIWFAPLFLHADDVVTEALVKDLNSESVVVRGQAARRLGQLGVRGVSPVLVRLLADTDPTVRREAARALGLLKDSLATEALAATLQDEDQNVRFYAAYALGEIKDRRSVRPLLKAMDDPAWPVRDQAAWALKEIGGPLVIRSLISRLIGSAGRLQPEVAVLKDLDRDQTLVALGEALEHQSDRARERVLIAVAALQDARAIPFIMRSLEDPSPRVRRRAVQYLSMLRDRQWVQPLMRVAQDDPDPAIRSLAQEAVDGLSHTSQLLAHWSFDSLRGSTVRDETGNGNDGQAEGCEPVPGRKGSALRFGPKRFVEIGRPPEIPVGNVPFTVTAWVKTEEPEGVAVARGGAACGFSLYVKDGAPKFGIHRVDDGPGYIASGDQLPMGQWVHLAGVVHQRRIELYVDGQLAGSAETVGYLPSECGQGMEIGFDAGNSAAEITTPWKGLIDEVKVFGAALSPAEVRLERGGG